MIPLCTAQAAGQEPEQLPQGTPLTQAPGLQPLSMQIHGQGNGTSVTHDTESLACNLYGEAWLHQRAGTNGVTQQVPPRLETLSRCFPSYHLLEPQLSCHLAAHFSTCGTNCSSKTVLYVSREGFSMRHILYPNSNFACCHNIAGKLKGLRLVFMVRSLKNEKQKFSVVSLK